MKKLIIALTFIITSIASWSQERFQGVLKPGLSPNSFIVAIRSNTAFSGRLSNFNVVIRIASSVTPQPSVQVKNFLLGSFIPAFPAPVVETFGGYYNYMFGTSNPSLTGVTPYNFPLNTDVDVVEFHVLNGPNITGTVELAHIGDGLSPNFNVAEFYTEVENTDYTNRTVTFIGAGANNGGSYSTNSFVPLAGVTLPVKFGAFYAYKQDNNGILNWAVENQTPLNSHFEIERSFDGRSFTKIGRTDVVMTPGGLGNYEYNDAGVFDSYTGTVYYRIKQIDRNGESVYSPVRSIKADGKGFGLSLYPNPVEKVANLAFTMPKAQPITIVLADANGKRITDYSIQAQRGLNQKQLNVSALAAGSYMFIIRTEDESQTLPFVKGN